MNTTTFICKINRTILGKTFSHGVFLSNNSLMRALFGFTSDGSKTYHTFYIRKDYYSSPSPKSYSLTYKLENSELRLSNLSDPCKALGITETDELILERIEIDEDDRNPIFLINKKTVSGVLILKKLNVEKDIHVDIPSFAVSDNMFWIWDNSDKAEMWDSILDKETPGSFLDSETIRQVTFKIRKVDTLDNIICGGDRRHPKLQSKTIYEVSVFGDNGIIPLNLDLYSLEIRGSQLVMKSRTQKNTFFMFNTRTIEKEGE